VDFNEKEYEYGQSNGPFFKLGMTILSPGKSNNSQILKSLAEPQAKGIR
jgi:hypothetical protein